MGVILFLLAYTVPVPPARALPLHLLDEAHTSLVAEAGDRFVVRLPDADRASWRPGPSSSPMIVALGPPGGTLTGRYREFRYQLRRAGRVSLTFVRSGARPAVLRFSVEAR